MRVHITDDGWLEVYDETTKEKNSKAFYNLKMAAEGETFIAALLKNGKIEVYDKKLNFINSEIIPEAKKLIVNSRIVVQLKDGCMQFYDRSLNLQFSRKIA